MRQILKPLEAAALEYVNVVFSQVIWYHVMSYDIMYHVWFAIPDRPLEILCSDGVIRMVVFPLCFHAGDWIEQCDILGLMKSCNAGQPCNMCHISVHQVCNPHHIISYDIIWHHIGEHFAAIQHWTRRSSYCRRVGAVQGNGRRRGRIGASWVQGPSWFNVQRAVNAALQCSGMFHDIILCHMTSPAVSVQPFWTKHPFFDPTICCPPDRMRLFCPGQWACWKTWHLVKEEERCRTPKSMS